MCIIILDCIVLFTYVFLSPSCRVIYQHRKEIQSGGALVWKSARQVETVQAIGQQGMANMNKLIKNKLQNTILFTFRLTKEYSETLFNKLGVNSCSLDEI